MAKFNVSIWRMVHQSAEIEVEAASEEDAIAKARDQYSNGPRIEWELDEVHALEFDAEEVTHAQT